MHLRCLTLLPHHHPHKKSTLAQIRSQFWQIFLSSAISQAQKLLHISYWLVRPCIWINRFIFSLFSDTSQRRGDLSCHPVAGLSASKEHSELARTPFFMFNQFRKVTTFSFYFRYRDVQPWGPSSKNFRNQTRGDWANPWVYKNSRCILVLRTTWKTNFIAASFDGMHNAPALIHSWLAYASGTTFQCTGIHCPAVERESIECQKEEKDKEGEIFTYSSLITKKPTTWYHFHVSLNWLNYQLKCEITSQAKVWLDEMLSGW